MEIQILPFSKVIKDSTKKFTKIKKEIYLSNGKYKIVDQGKEFICGYTNDETLVNFEDIPIIIFGDHTKVFKFIDFPLAIGADGVKVLEIDSNIADTKYIYYFLKSIQLHDAGYSRHFKYLKVKKISLPKTLDEQIKIANLLTQVESLIAQREESIRLLDELLRSSFLDMFGDPVLNEKGWEKDKLFNLTSKIGSGSTPRGGKEVYLNEGYYFIRSQNVRMNKLIYETMYYIDETIHQKMKNTWVKYGDVLLNITGASIGRVAYFEKEDNSANVNQHVSILRPKHEVLNYIYLSYCISQNNFQKQIMKKNVGGTREAFNFSQMKNFIVPVPPKPLQDKFATIVQQVEETKEKYQKSLDELRDLFGSLSQRAFRGELDLGGMPSIESHAKSGAEDLHEILDVPPSTRRVSLKKVSGITEVEIIDILKSSEQPLNLYAIVKEWHKRENTETIHFKEIHYASIKDKVLEMIENGKIEQKNYYAEVLLGVKSET